VRCGKACGKHHSPLTPKLMGTQLPTVVPLFTIEW
jgi:hypothetical protein